jgi:hypothetical protein
MLKRMLEGREPRCSFDKWRRLSTARKNGRATLGLANARYRLPEMEAGLAESLRREKDGHAQLATARRENVALRTRAQEAESEVERLKGLMGSRGCGAAA